MTKFVVRTETPGDEEAVRRVNRLAFGRDDEANLVDALRDGGHTVISVVATSDEGDENIVGHALFSEVSVDEGSAGLLALALAPVAVLPGFQRRGAGTAIITSGLELCREVGCDLVLVLGDPGYYRRFGFSTALAENLESPYSGEYFMALRLTGDEKTPPIQGVVRYPPPFG